MQDLTFPAHTPNSLTRPSVPKGCTVQPEVILKGLNYFRHCQKHRECNHVTVFIVYRKDISYHLGWMNLGEQQQAGFCLFL